MKIKNPTTGSVLPLLMTLIILSMLFSCREDEVLDDKDTPIEPKQRVVYVAGVEKAGDAFQPYIAKYWRNGVEHKLTNGKKDATAKSIFIDGENIYVGGSEENSGRLNHAVYWKNGIRALLTDSSSMTSYAYVNKIIVVDGVVHAVGQFTGDGFSHAAYWSDGKMTLLGKSKQYMSAASIAIEGDDVHIVGIETNDLKQNIARYWKNGVMSALPGGEVASDIDLENGHVYICGYNAKEAMYWKDGQSEVLKNSYHASGIQVVNETVFVAGPGRYWTNSVGTPLLDLKNKEANISSIFVIGDDVYTPGFTNNGSVYVARYWKNGNPSDITDGSKYALALDIFVTD